MSISGSLTGSVSAYRPAQQRVIDLLGRPRRDAPPLDPQLSVQLREELEARLHAAAALIPPGQALWVGKSHLTAHESCPGRWRAQADAPFAWTVPSARGTVGHKAIELSVHWRGQVEPCRAVDAAIERYLDDDGSTLGRYLRTLSTVELAELRGEAVGLVTAFEESFPPLKGRWRPVLDGSVRAELCGGRVVLSGRPDLTLGQSLRAGKVIIDLKTGVARPHHVHDLRLYALLDTLRVGIAPRRVATFYLESATPADEAVTEATLRHSVDRVARTVVAMIEARWGTAPVQLRSGAHCRWCPAAPRCAAAEAWHLDQARADSDPAGRSGTGLRLSA